VALISIILSGTRITGTFDNVRKISFKGVKWMLNGGIAFVSPGNLMPCLQTNQWTYKYLIPNIRGNDVRFEVVTAVTMKDVVFWDIKTQFVLHSRQITPLLQSPAS
jgi:hypothetical protein